MQPCTYTSAHRSWLALPVEGFVDAGPKLACAGAAAGAAARGTRLGAPAPVPADGESKALQPWERFAASYSESRVSGCHTPCRTKHHALAVMFTAALGSRYSVPHLAQRLFLPPSHSTRRCTSPVSRRHGLHVELLQFSLA